MNVLRSVCQLSVIASVLAAAVLGCSSSSSATATGSDASSTSDGCAAAASNAADAAIDVVVPAPPLHSCPTAVYKTLVIVGDSISDVGGNGPGQTPFYRTLLVQNDDAKYPDWKGIDLKTCWGLDATTQVVKVSKGGAIATQGKKLGQSVLLDQVKSIPTTLAGPVLVVGTIGGNDATAGLVHVVANMPDAEQQDIADFATGFGDAMTELTKPDRFGPGVKADVLITNIYDPTGGNGDFTYAPLSQSCGGMFAMWPDKQPTDGAVKMWNDAMTAQAAKFPSVHLLDMHAFFLGHQVDTPDPTNWFHDDCIHPNAVGQEAIRELFWAAMLLLK